MSLVALLKLRRSTRFVSSEAMALPSRGESYCGHEVSRVYACTRPAGHRGRHVAHGVDGHVISIEQRTGP